MLSSVFGTLVVVLLAAEAPPAELTDKTVDQWRDRIRPKSDELCFATVNWLPTFGMG